MRELQACFASKIWRFFFAGSDWSFTIPSLTCFDPIRSRFVRATPEELVRQQMIQKMIGELRFPKGLIAVEKELSSLRSCGSNRRIDIVCYVPGTDGLKPLLLIECKAEWTDLAAEKQAFGYNHIVGAPFIALAHRSGVKTFWREGNKIRSVPFLPRFIDLVANYD